MLEQRMERKSCRKVLNSWQMFECHWRYEADNWWFPGREAVRDRVNN